jgi:hypothetical protein
MPDVIATLDSGATISGGNSGPETWGMRTVQASLPPRRDHAGTPWTGLYKNSAHTYTYKASCKSPKTFTRAPGARLSDSDQSNQDVRYRIRYFQESKTTTGSSSSLVSDGGLIAATPSSSRVNATAPS